MCIGNSSRGAACRKLNCCTGQGGMQCAYEASSAIGVSAAHPDSHQEVHDVPGGEERALHNECQQAHSEAAQPPDQVEAAEEEEPAPGLKLADADLRTAVASLLDTRVLASHKILQSLSPAALSCLVICHDSASFALQRQHAGMHPAARRACERGPPP